MSTGTSTIRITATTTGRWIPPASRTPMRMFIRGWCTAIRIIPTSTTGTSIERHVGL